MDIHVPVIPTLIVVGTIVGLAWALWPRESERSSGGMFSIPDILSPMLRLIPVLIFVIVALFVWAVSK